MRSITALVASDGARALMMTAYYVAIVVALMALYGTGNFSPPPFVYQGF